MTSGLPAEKDLAHLKRDPVRVHLPKWIFGGSRAGLCEFVDWDHSADGDYDFIRNREGVVGQRPELLRVAKLGLIGRPGDRRGYARLEELLRHDEMMPSGTWDRVVEANARLGSNSPDSNSMMIQRGRNSLMAVEQARYLPDVAATVMAEACGKMPGARLHMISTADSLGHRYGVIRALANIDPRSLQPTSPNDSAVTSASRGLMSDTVLGLDSYFSPLLTSLSPLVWGTNVTRPGAVLLLTFGGTRQGRSQRGRDYLGLNRRGGVPDPVDGHLDDVEAFEEAIRWWVGRLDLLFSHATDPTNYEVDGLFHPGMALEKMIALEQICRSVQAVATTGDSHARRLLLFHVLESVSGLNRSLQWDKLTNPVQLSKWLDQIEEAMPLKARDVLLPRARAAILALGELQHEFLVPQDPRGIELPADGGGIEWVELHRATSEWLRLVRNSHHGFDRPTTPRQKALLAKHSGELPDRLPDLAWLVLLRLLESPHLLRRHR